MSNLSRRARAEQLAWQFHDTYEQMARRLGYDMREETRHLDLTSPHGKLMVAVIEAVIIPALIAEAQAATREHEVWKEAAHVVEHWVNRSGPLRQQLAEEFRRRATHAEGKNDESQGL